MFSQPSMEAHLLEVSTTHTNLSHLWGCDLIAVQDNGDHVLATIRDSMGGDDKIRAKFVVGCDGANSKVREELGIKMQDLGFFYEWLVWIELDF
jgi:2-polyprenyl-6-methoxyphenol hydroxylase-like FAD-dependent oxidoreductase